MNQILSRVDFANLLEFFLEFRTTLLVLELQSEQALFMFGNCIIISKDFEQMKKEPRFYRKSLFFFAKAKKPPFAGAPQTFPNEEIGLL